MRDLETGLEYQAADLRLEDPPADESSDDYLAAQQTRLFDIFSLQQQREELAEQQQRQNQQQDPSRLGLPYYLGEDMELVSTSLSPDESKLLITHSDALNPPELFVKTVAPGSKLTRLTATVSAEFRALPWTLPTVSIGW